MNKVIIVYKKDKTISVIYPVIKSKLINESEEEFIDRVRKKAMNSNNDEYKIIDKNELPDRKYRNAWEYDNNKNIIINEDKKVLIDKL